MKDLETILNKFAKGVDRLDAALDGLSDSDLDLTRAEGAWSIRQIVHHIADAEEIWKIAVKAALGNSGCTFDITWYEDNNLCADPLDYANRPIDTAVAFFIVARQEVVELAKHFSDALDRHLFFYKESMDEPQRFNIMEIIRFQTMHLDRHVKQITKTRTVHNI